VSIFGSDRSLNTPETPTLAADPSGCALNAGAPETAMTAITALATGFSLKRPKSPEKAQ
jgi:hypothetical protein